MRIKLTGFLFFVASLILCAQSVNATNYFVDGLSGDDGKSGTSQVDAWKSLDRVNIAVLSAGDTVFFKRGGVYRGNLVPVYSGNSTSRITFKDYGTGAKPIFMASYNRSQSSDWTSLGGNVWSTGFKDGSPGSEIIANTGFESGTTSWYTSSGGGVTGLSYTRVTAAETSPYQGTYSAKLSVGANNGGGISDIQFVYDQITTKAVTWYKLTFAAKGASNFNATVALFKAGSPYDNYILKTVIGPGQTWPPSANILASSNPPVVPITSSWQEYTLYIQTNGKASLNKGRLSLQLGDQLPENSSVYLDAFSLKECASPVEYYSSIAEDATEDVGNIIFSGVSPIFCGKKVWSATKLNAEGDFYYDHVNKQVLLYTTHGNPATYFGNIELASAKLNVYVAGKSYLNFENLDLRYGGGGGILTLGYKSTSTGLAISPSQITVRGVDISYVGGGRLGVAGVDTVRAGNGVGFWDGANNITVEKCRINQVYDSGISPQGSLKSAVFNKIYLRNNIIDSCEQSFEIWQTAANTAITTGTSSMSEVYFDNNTCRNAGYGWSHNQRPLKLGTHLLFYDLASDVNFSNIYIRNNIFDKSADYGIYSHWADKLVKITGIDYNIWNPGVDKPMLYVKYPPGSSTVVVTTYNWAGYRSIFSRDPNSWNTDPLLQNDGSIPVSSPAKDAGLDIAGLTGLQKHQVITDYLDNARPFNVIYDMGAFESQETSEMLRSSPISGTAFKTKANQVYVPNAFSPNNDGKNDTFLIYGNTIRSSKMSIYSQGRQLLFQSGNSGFGWDGTYKGVNQPVGVYVYSIEVTFNDGSKTIEKGTVTLLR